MGRKGGKGKGSEFISRAKTNQFAVSEAKPLWKPDWQKVRAGVPTAGKGTQQAATLARFQSVAELQLYATGGSRVVGTGAHAHVAQPAALR